MEKVVDNKRNSYLLILLKGVLVSLSISLVLVLIFAFVLRFIVVPDNLIAPINQIIKCVSVLFGTFAALKNKNELGLVTGLLVGLLFTVVAFFVFSLLDGSISFSKVLINDLFFGGITGAICGIVAVSFRSKK